MVSSKGTIIQRSVWCGSQQHRSHRSRISLIHYTRTHASDAYEALSPYTDLAGLGGGHALQNGIYKVLTRHSGKILLFADFTYLLGRQDTPEDTPDSLANTNANKTPVKPTNGAHTGHPSTLISDIASPRSFREKVA